MPEMTPLANMAYTAIKSKSDRIKKRKSLAGRMSGASKNNQNAAKQAKQAEGVKTTYRTSTVSVSVYINDNVNARAREEITDDVVSVAPPAGALLPVQWA